MTKEKESEYKKFNSQFGRYVEEIRDKTLLGDFWGKCGAVSIQKQIIDFYRAYCRWDKIYKDNTSSIFPVELFSMTSSTYYAAGGNAGSRAKVSNLFLKPFWYWIAWRCLRKAEKLSDKFAGLRPMEDMSLGELDTRACILNKAGRQREACIFLNHGVKRILTGQVGTKHDLCLFLIHEAEIIAGMRRYDKENKAEKNYQQAFKLMENRAVPVLTSVRIMKSYGKFLSGVDRITEAKEVLTKALILAEASDLNDQVVKIKALFGTLK